MKNFSKFLILSLFCFYNVNAQVPFSLTSGGVNYTANNNISFTFATNELANQGSQFKYNITNTSSQPLNFKTQIMGLTNYTSGQELAFCFAYFCEFDVVLNQIYPPANEPFLMQPGENMNTVGENDCKFQNSSVGTNPNLAKEFVIRFFAENPDTNMQVGDAFTLTFIYDPNLSTAGNTMESIGIQLQSTILNQALQLNAFEKTNLKVINVLGQSVMHVELNEGSNNIQTDFLNAGVYILNFETASNKTASQKVIKK